MASTPTTPTRNEVMVIERGRGGDSSSLKITIKYKSPGGQRAEPTPSTSAPQQRRKSEPKSPKPPGAEKIWNCDKCEIDFPAKSTYYYHMNKHKILDGTGKIRCSKCEEQFVSRRDLKRHMRMHETGKSSFWCKECNKRFATQGTFKRHLKSHWALKKGCFQCQICSKVFSSRKHLLRHKVTTHPRRHLDSFVAQICPMCNEGFLTKNSFIQHMSIHIKQENSGMADSDEEVEYDEMPILDVQPASVQTSDPIGDDFGNEVTLETTEVIPIISNVTSTATSGCAEAVLENGEVMLTPPPSEDGDTTTEVVVGETVVEVPPPVENVIEVPPQVVTPPPEAPEDNAKSTVKITKKKRRGFRLRKIPITSLTPLIKQLATPTITTLVCVLSNDVPEYPY